MSGKTGLKYMVIGAGGTGGSVGAHLANSGADVTFIARGRHLEAMLERGLRVIKPSGGFTISPVKAYTSDEFLMRNGDRPDIIFVCVKGYSVDSVVPFIRKAAAPDTIVIPILNIFGTGGRVQEDLPGITVTDGCIYVAAEIKEPGVIWMNGEILRVVFGLRKDQKAAMSDPEIIRRLEIVRDDLNISGIRGILSDNIERDAMRKFSYVSPQGACGLLYDVPAGAMQQPGEERECFAGLVHEIEILADAMGIGFGEDAVSANLAILDNLSPDMTTSMQRDIAAGRSSEIDGLIYEVVRLGEKYGVDLPLYKKICDDLKLRGIA